MYFEFVPLMGDKAARKYDSLYLSETRYALNHGEGVESNFEKRNVQTVEKGMS